MLMHERAIADEVAELYISPTDGSFLGFSCFDPIQKKIRFVPVSEVKRINTEGVFIAGYESIADLDDLVRLQEAVKQKINIIGSTVFTKQGIRIGKVNEAALDTISLLLDRIFVTPVHRIKFLTQDLIIPAKKIDQILPKKIIVADGVLKEKNTARLFAPAPLLE